MFKKLLSAMVVCGLAAPSAMAQSIGISIGGCGANIGGALGSIVNGITGGCGGCSPMTGNGNGQNGLKNGLPLTSTDSFVYEAGGSADLIYGDEGTDDIPPYFEFTKDHRINAGIFGQRDAGLTTGHGSYLPDAWGGDEWTGNEWDQSGASNSIPMGGLPGLNIGIGSTGVNVNIGCGCAGLTLTNSGLPGLNGGLNINSGGVSGGLTLGGGLSVGGSTGGCGLSGGF